MHVRILTNSHWQPDLRIAVPCADGMIFVVIAIYIGWKIVKRTRFWRGHEIDFVTDLQDINDYTEDVSCIHPRMCL